MNTVIFDLETTGFSHTWSEIIQIAAVRMVDGGILWNENFSSFVRPVRNIPPFISDITGITDADVEVAPPFAEVITAFSTFVGTSTLLGHNARRFDMPFIRASCARHALSVRDVPFVDSLDFSRAIWGGRSGHGLDAIMSRLQMRDDTASRHTAPGDVALLGDVVLRMWTRLSADFHMCPVSCSVGCLPTFEQQLRL
ncbi:MAG: 3'-5' exonuclease [Chthoniobacterales bacterium]|nr:3'-5' exonuclease [Chthoniobacterales bacterium]